MTQEAADTAQSTTELKAQYLEIIKQYENEFSKWEERAKEIVKRYLDERNTRNADRKRFNILWSNVQTLSPALYFQPPKPNIERRFRDKDPVGRVTSDILERATSYYINDCGFSVAAEQVVLDRLLGGRGTMWFRYVPHFKDAAVQDNPQEQAEGVEVTNEEQTDEQPEQELDYEEVSAEYVDYQDFGHNVCRTWAEVTKVWRRVFMDRKELIARFGDIGEKIPLDYTPVGMRDAQHLDGVKKATIYEVWDKTKKAASWLHKDTPELLDSVDDPLKLKQFFPCPRPLYSTLGNKSLIPTPDYVEYQDQARELDEITARISALVKAVKVVGVYDTSASGLQNLLSEGLENRMVPVENWAMFAEKGGLKGATDWFPVENVVEALLSLYDAREKVKADLYEITGLSDIIRGASDPNETAAAQKLKGQYANMRLNKMQGAVADFMRDSVGIMAEIIAGHFSRETLAMISGVQLFTEQEKQQIQFQQQQAQLLAQRAQAAPLPQGAPGVSPPPSAPQPPQPPQLPPDIIERLSEPSWEQVEQLMRNNAALHFKIDIETDSTIKADQDADKASRIEFLEAVGQFITQASQAPPEFTPILGEMLLFGARGFKTGKALEGVLEDFVEKMQKQPPQRPDPNAAKAQAQVQQAQIKAGTDMQKAKLDQQTDLQSAAMNTQMQQQLEQMKIKHADDMERMKMQLSLVKTQMEVNGRIKEAAVTAAMSPAPVVSGARQ